MSRKKEAGKKFRSKIEIAVGMISSLPKFGEEVDVSALGTAGSKPENSWGNHRKIRESA
jgi:hypothetical protein